MTVHREPEGPDRAVSKPVGGAGAPAEAPGGSVAGGDPASIDQTRRNPVTDGGHPLLNRTAVVLAFAGYTMAVVYVARRWDMPPIGPQVAILIALALAVELVAKTLFAIQFRYTLRRQNHPVSLRASVYAGFIGTAVARLVPAGGALSPSAMAWGVRAEGDHAAGAALRTTFTSYGGLLLVTGLAFGYAVPGGDFPRPSFATVTIGAALVAVGAITLVGSRWIGPVVSVLPRLLRVHFGPTAGGGSVTGYELLLIVSRIALEALVLSIVLRAFGIDLSFDEALITFGVAKVIGGLPATPGGIGLVEGGMVGVLAAIGFSAESALAPVLVYQIIDYWIVAGLGLVAASRVSRATTRQAASL